MGPFCFIQAADPQLGLMKAWREGDCDGGGDEWAEEVELTKQAVEAVNQLRPRFMVLCGDLVHAMPGGDREQRNRTKCTLKNSMRISPLHGGVSISVFELVKQSSVIFEELSAAVSLR